METTYKLLFPVMFGSEKIESININRPKGKHLKDLPASPQMWDLIKIASKSSGVSINAFEEMDGQDLLQIGALMGKFWTDGQATGG